MKRKDMLRHEFNEVRVAMEVFDRDEQHQLLFHFAYRWHQIKTRCSMFNQQIECT